MERADELKNIIAELYKEIKIIKEETLTPLNNKLKEAEQLLAEELCFCKVGDKIRRGNDDHVIVSKIIHSYGGFRIKAYKVKKNGEKYKYDHEVYGWRGWGEWKVVN